MSRRGAGRRHRSYLVVPRPGHDVLPYHEVPRDRARRHEATGVRVEYAWEIGAGVAGGGEEEGEGQDGRGSQGLLRPPAGERGLSRRSETQARGEPDGRGGANGLE